jgi:glycosyltransferase involved in cell wall biosynthesis
VRILYFTNGYTPHDRRFLSKLAESEHDIWFLPLEDERSLENELPAGINSAKWRNIPGNNTIAEKCLSFVPDFEKILAEIKPNVVHAGPIQSCAFITALSGFHPFLAMSWGSDILADADKNPCWRWITCYTLRRSDMLLCDCDAVRLKAVRLVDYPAQRMVQLPWGVDLKAFSAGAASRSLREELGWNDAYVVLSTRSWEPLYGIDVILSAFQKAYGRDRRMRLILLGSGSQAAQVEDFIKSHELTDAVYIPGPVVSASIPDFYKAADLYVSCTHSDGTSVSLLEAMASDLPVIVTDLAANREWVEHGVNGWLVPDENAEELARLMILSAKLSSEDRHRIGRRNRRIVEERADWHRNFERLNDAYQKFSLSSPSRGLNAE